MLTTHFGEMNIRQQDKQGNIGVTLNLLIIIFSMYKRSANVFCFIFIISYTEQCTNFLKDVTAEKFQQNL